MEWNQFFQWAVQALLVAILGYAVKVLADMRSSIQQLNDRMATVVEKVTWHEKILDKHETVIGKLLTAKAERR